MLSFQSPGPGGTTSGTETDTVTAQWSENGHGQMVAPVTDGTHEKGTPTMSIRDEILQFHLVQVKAEASGCRYRQMSVTHTESNKWERATVLSRRVSAASEPARSNARSKTVLKSPHTMVGTAGSRRSATSPKKVVPCRITVRRINTGNAKDLIRERKLPAEEPTLRITKRTHQRKTRMKQQDTTTRLNGTRRRHKGITRGKKPGGALGNTGAMRLLQTEKVRQRWKRTQPVKETTTLGGVS